jgi:hypothetical protein
MAIANIALLPVVRNDTWDGLSGCKFSSTGTAFASPLATVRMSFKDSTGAVQLALSSDTPGEATITDAAGWEFEIPARKLSMPDGAYSWGIETTDSAGIVKTRVIGTITILPDPV